MYTSALLRRREGASQPSPAKGRRDEDEGDEAAGDEEERAARGRRGREGG